MAWFNVANHAPPTNNLHMHYTLPFATARIPLQLNDLHVHTRCNIAIVPERICIPVESACIAYATYVCIRLGSTLAAHAIRRVLFEHSVLCVTMTKAYIVCSDILILLSKPCRAQFTLLCLSCTHTHTYAQITLVGIDWAKHLFAAIVRVFFSRMFSFAQTHHTSFWGDNHRRRRTDEFRPTACWLLPRYDFLQFVWLKRLTKWIHYNYMIFLRKHIWEITKRKKCLQSCVFVW